MFVLALLTAAVCTALMFWWWCRYAYLYLGDLLAYSAGSSGYTEVVPVRAARAPAGVCGVLAVRLDGLHVLRRCLLLHSPNDKHS
ncbi:hypothetical protein HF086_006630 [Spodoptera exigua]|uniref:Uncharacterized protein n=1 Tax=Spodoptera exigua TaxID=7107 RepID=A0A922SBZ0_SPOEX|nr:hypothetical protein HF086_006630 [Spodoptera exigua]